MTGEMVLFITVGAYTKFELIVCLFEFVACCNADFINLIDYQSDFFASFLRYNDRHADIFFIKVNGSARDLFV